MAATKSLRKRGLDKGRREMLNTFKEAKNRKTSGRLNLKDVKATKKMMDSVKGKDASAKAKEARGLKSKLTPRMAKLKGMKSMIGGSKKMKPLPMTPELIKKAKDKTVPNPRAPITPRNGSKTVTPLRRKRK